MNDYITSLAFQNSTNIFESMIEDAKLQLFINESIALSEKDLTNLSLINEGFKDKVKVAWDKLMAMIAKIWAKFMAKVDELFKSNSDYLSKYKNIILNVPLSDEEYNMYPYWKGTDELKKLKVPKFESDKILKDNDECAAEYYKKYYKKDIELKDNIRNILRGSDEMTNIPKGQIPMTEMYNYCKDFDKLASLIEKDVKALEDGGNTVKKLLRQIKTESVDIISGERYVYSSILESFINEKVIPGGDKNKDGKPDDTEKKNNGELNKKAANGDEGSIKLINDKIDSAKTYVRVSQSVISVKMEIAQSAYEDYMFIIKDHVKKNADAKPKKDNSTEDTKKKEDTSSKENKQNEKDSGSTDKGYSIIDKVKNAVKKNKSKKVKESAVDESAANPGVRDPNCPDNDGTEASRKYKNRTDGAKGVRDPDCPDNDGTEASRKYKNAKKVVDESNANPGVRDPNCPDNDGTEASRKYKNAKDGAKGERDPNCPDNDGTEASRKYKNRKENMIIDNKDAIDIYKDPEESIQEFSISSND